MAFYSLLGLEIPDALPEWQAHHRTVSLGDGVDLDFDSIEVVRMWDRGWPGGAGGALGLMSPIDPTKTGRPTPP